MARRSAGQAARYVIAWKNKREEKGKLFTTQDVGDKINKIMPGESEEFRVDVLGRVLSYTGKAKPVAPESCVY